MAGFGAIFNNPFGGQNVKPKSANNTAKPFIASYADITGAEDADIIEATVLKSYTQNSQNNPGRNSEDSFSAKKNFDFSESVPFSQVGAGRVAQSLSDRSFPTGSNRYGSSHPFSSFGSPKEKLAQVGRELANA